MNILFYISTIRGGGAARVMVNLANSLIKRKHQVTLVTNFPDEHEYLLNNGINRINLEKEENKSNFLSRNIVRIVRLRKIIIKEKPDVCIAFMRENNFRLFLSTIYLNTKTLVSVRNDPEKEYPTIISRVLANCMYKKLDGIIFQTEEAQGKFSSCVKNKSKVLVNPIDEKFFNQVKENGEYLLACGRLSEQKNYPMMLNAFSKVLKKFPDESLRIYGDGRLKEYLISMSKELGIEKNVCFMNYNPDIEKIYRKAKLLLLSSDYEGIPNVVLEAIATGTPVVSTDCPCGGSRMIIEEGVNGYLVPCNKDNEFANAIIRLLSDEKLLQRLNKSTKNSSEKYQPERIINHWENYIIDVCRR